MNIKNFKGAIFDLDGTLLDSMHIWHDVDEEFFRRFDSIIRDNLGNNDFSNETLARLLNMSESTMLRKIKKLLNTSPNNYIRTVRLSVAADLLKDSHGNNISEICYTVGFSSVSYFAKCFREQYGMSPSEWCNRG